VCCGEGGLSNAEIRQITRLDRHQVSRLMKELQREEHAVVREGVGKGSRYCFLVEGDPGRFMRSDM
jgi:DNA-binding transcriptional regulator GbsR (MarR family)